MSIPYAHLRKNVHFGKYAYFGCAYYEWVQYAQRKDHDSKLSEKFLYKLQFNTFLKSAER